MRPPAGEDFYDVIDGRYQRASTILTSNRAFNEWLELFDQPVLASAGIDRMAHGVTQITITGELVPNEKSEALEAAAGGREGLEARRRTGRGVIPPMRLERSRTQVQARKAGAESPESESPKGARRAISHGRARPPWGPPLWAFGPLGRKENGLQGLRPRHVREAPPL